MRLHSLIPVALCASLATAQTSNPLPDWSTLPIGKVTSQFVEATIVVAQEPGKINCYSSFTRRWNTFNTVSSNPAYTGYDDHCIIQDGALCWGYSTRFGTFEPMPVPNGTLIKTPAQAWVSVVQLNNDAYLFSPLLNTWNRYTFASPPTISVARLVSVLTDGTNTVALSAHFGQYVPIKTTGSVTIGSRGLCGYVQDGKAVHCFSAYRNTWTTIPTSISASVRIPPSRASYLVVEDGTKAYFYSAVTGKVLAVTTTASTAWTLSDDIAILEDPSSPIVDCFSGIAGTQVKAAFPVQRTITVRRYLATIEHAGKVDVFSAPLGKLATTLDGTFTVVSDLTVAAASSGTTPAYAYSALTNTWSAVPATVKGGVVYPTWCSVCVDDPAGGLWGFSAETGTWAFQSAPPSTKAYQTGAMFCAQSGTRLDTFNPRHAVWRSVDTGTAVNTVTCFDQALLAEKGSEVWAYCLYTDYWSKRSLGSTPVGTQVRDELTVAFTATTLHVFGASDQLSNVAIFPYYWRVLTHGGPIDYHLAGRSGDASLFMLNTRSTSIMLPGIGHLQVDPIGAIMFPMPLIPSEGIQRLPFVVPDDQTLVGQTVWAQAFMVSSQDGIYLTEPNRMTIF
ncbi:MAG: hypothetical protein R3F30_15715 [Planctomycetota bacterium]